MPLSTTMTRYRAWPGGSPYELLLTCPLSISTGKHLLVSTPKLSPTPFIRRNLITKWCFIFSLHCYSPFLHVLQCFWDVFGSDYLAKFIFCWWLESYSPESELAKFYRLAQTLTPGKMVNSDSNSGLLWLHNPGKTSIPFWDSIPKTASLFWSLRVNVQFAWLITFPRTFNQ